MLIIQDMQNDAVSEGGAFAASGAPAHAKAQNVVENIRRVAAAARAHGVPVIHVWFVVEPGAPGVTLNAPLFKGLAEHKAVVRGTWGAAPVEGLEPDLGDFVVEKMRMSAWEGTRLETILKALHRDTIINTGAWTNMSIEHTARTGADKGYVIITPEDCCATMNADWHKASIDYAMQNVAEVTKADAVIAALKGEVRRKADARRSSLEQSRDFVQRHDRSVGADEGFARRSVADHIKPRRARGTGARAAVLDRDDRLRRQRQAARGFPVGFGIGLARRDVVETQRERDHFADSQRLDVGVDDPAPGIRHAGLRHSALGERLHRPRGRPEWAGALLRVGDIIVFDRRDPRLERQGRRKARLERLPDVERMDAAKRVRREDR